MLTAVENTPNERSLLATPGLSQTALSALLDNAGRMSSGSSQVASPTVAGTPGGFMPLAPLTLAEMGIPETELEALLLKLLLHRGVLAGRTIADQLALPFQPLQKMLQRMKTENLLIYKGSTHLHDYAYDLTPSGFERAQRYRARCSYIGAAPVSLRDYTNSVSAQSCHKTRPQLEDVRRAFADIILSPGTIDKLGQAARGGKAMFLYGSPGNGKTTIAERICRAFGPSVWVPRAINIDGEIIRVFDPIVHKEAPLPKVDGEQDLRRFDERWVRIKRPTIVVGGELTMESLELTPVASTGVIEAPIQLKANCGTLVIDDFGRQRIGTRELLNRWIFPLENRLDFLNTPGGKKVQVPFDEFVVFATNLAPKDLVDEAFLRRIPYKIEILDPSEAEFRRMISVAVQRMGITFEPEGIDYLIAKHYRGATKRPFRACHPRDLLTQVQNLCEFRGQAPRATPELIDAVIENYFVGF